MQIVLSTHAHGVFFNWVGLDSFYGEAPSLQSAYSTQNEII